VLTATAGARDSASAELARLVQAPASAPLLAPRALLCSLSCSCCFTLPSSAPPTSSSAQRLDDATGRLGSLELKAASAAAENDRHGQRLSAVQGTLGEVATAVKVRGLA
jgi:hypothetical protein